MVPKEWISPPDVETADGELLEEEGEDDDADADENVGMLESERRQRRAEDRRRQRDRDAGEGSSQQANSLAGGRRITSTDDPPARLVSVKDAGGREMPVAERAPIPKKT